MESVGGPWVTVHPDVTNLNVRTIRMMVLDDLRCFLAAVNAPTFRAAAAKVALSPTAFSERIQRLERDVGSTLFHRTSRRVTLSDAGRRLEAHARDLLAEAERCRAVARGEHRPLPYEITVGTRFELGISWLAPMLSALEQARPERTVHLYVGDTADLLARVERGDIDAAVLSARLNRPRMDYASLHAESYVFVAATGTVFETPGDHRLIDVSPDLPLFRYLLDAMPHVEPWRFAGHRYMGGIGGVRFLIERGEGVGVLPEYYARPGLQSGALVQLLPEQPLLSDAFRLVWRSSHPWGDRLVELAASMRERPLE